MTYPCVACICYVYICTDLNIYIYIYTCIHIYIYTHVLSIVGLSIARDVTGKPKGVVHVHAYLAGLVETMKVSFAADPAKDKHSTGCKK